jgi:hypothetical protein
MFVALAFLSSLFVVFKKKTPLSVSVFRVTQSTRPVRVNNVITPGQVSFYWIPTNANNYRITFRYLETWSTQINGFNVVYNGNTATLFYTGVETNQSNGTPNVIFNIRAMNDEFFASEVNDTAVRFELLNAL